jgi:serine/threonine protein phosphatase PrpC
MNRSPVNVPTIKKEEFLRILPRRMQYKGIERLFGHYTPIYMRYLVNAMDQYTWFRYVESESKNFIFKSMATKKLYELLKRAEKDHICSGNQNAVYIGSQATAISSRGVNYKAVNEDGFGIFEEGDDLRLVVCDGVGDCLVGEVASYVILNLFDRHPDRSSYDLFQMACNTLGQLGGALEKHIPEFESFPNEVSQAAVTALTIKGNQCEVAQVGDVLLFWARGDHMEMLSPQGKWLDVEQLSSLFADNNYLARRHIISNAIGRNYDSTWEPWHFELKSGDVLVLASDGIETLHPREVQRLIRSYPDSNQLMKMLFESIIQANLKWQTPPAPIYTKPDNATVVVYRHP